MLSRTSASLPYDSAANHTRPHIYFPAYTARRTTPHFPQSSTMDLNFTETSKGKPAALLGGHLFRLMAESKSSRTWRCTKKDCKARFTPSLETKEILHGMTNHSHSTTVDAASSQRLQLRQSCKRKSEHDLTERPRKIMVTEAQHMDTDVLNQRDLDNVRRAMWRQRRKHQPKLPVSRIDALRAIFEIETRHDAKIAQRLRQTRRPSRPVFTAHLQWSTFKGTKICLATALSKPVLRSSSTCTQSLRFQMESTSQWCFSCFLEVAKKSTLGCFCYLILFTI